jgi:DNA-binding Lrp family transcriptional regulator
LDSLDIRLVRELSQARMGLIWGDVSPAYRLIGRKLGVSKETVRERITKMKSSGFLRTFPIHANPNLFGLSLGALTFDVPASASKKDILHDLGLVEGVVTIVSHVGSMIGLVLFYEDEASRKKKVELISRISSATGQVDFTRVPYPECGVTMSRRDWEIVAALQGGGGRVSAETTRGLGFSDKTMRRRLKRMIDGRAIARFVSTDVRHLRGAVIADLVVYYTPGANRTAVDGGLLKDLDEVLFFPGLWSDHSVYSLILPSIPSAADILARVKANEGVRKARIELVEDRVELYEPFIEQVRKKLKPL